MTERSDEIWRACLDVAFTSARLSIKNPDRINLLELMDLVRRLKKLEKYLEDGEVLARALRDE